MKGLVCHAKEFGFYFEDSGELLRHYEQENDVIDLSLCIYKIMFQIL